MFETPARNALSSVPQQARLLIGNRRAHCAQPGHPTEQRSGTSATSGIESAFPSRRNGSRLTRKHPEEKRRLNRRSRSLPSSCTKSNSRQPARFLLFALSARNGLAFSSLPSARTRLGFSLPRPLPPRPGVLLARRPTQTKEAEHPWSSCL